MPSSCLVIKLGAIGDVAMAITYMLPVLRKRFDKVVWVCGKAVYPLLELCRRAGLVDEIICIDEKAILHGNVFAKCLTVWGCIRTLRGRKFDLCLIPYRDLRYYALRMGVQCGATLMFRGKYALVPGRYHAFEYARLALGLTSRDVLSAKALTHIQIPLDETHDSQERISDILLAPGNAADPREMSIRHWPLSHYVALAKMLVARGLSVGLVGFDKTGATRRAFANVPHNSWLNKTKLEDLPSLLSLSRVLVTHDTGLLHMMELVQGRYVAIFGPTAPEEKCLYGKGRKVLYNVDRLPCCPCYDGKVYAHCAEHKCLVAISPETVGRNVMDLLTQDDE